jgi:cell division septation protein DedD
MSEIEHDDDGLGSFDLSQLGQKVGAFGGATILKFVQGTFLTRDGVQIESTREFLSLGLAKLVQKFVGKKLLDTILVGQHDNFPDIEAMNESAPKEEWSVFNNKPQGPYSRCLVLKLLDMTTMDRFAFVTTSIGGGVGVGDLSDKTKLGRRLQGPNVSPVVSCRWKPFPNPFNPHNKRPHFEIVRWIMMGGDQALAKPAEALRLESAKAEVPTPKPAEKVEAVSANTAPPTTTATAASIVPEAKPIGTPVAEPTLQQEVDDKIIF